MKAKPQSDDKLKLAIDRARYWLLTNPKLVWYGSQTSMLRDVIDDSVPTAATDGVSIFYNRSFVATLSDLQLRYLVFHETMHCSHLHLWRLPFKNEQMARICNYVGDCEIEETLRGIDGIEFIPDGVICPPELEKLALEEKLDKVRRNPQNYPIPQTFIGAFTAPASGGKGEGKGDDGKPGNGAGNAIADTTLKEKWERAAIQALQAAKALGRGDMPGQLQAVADRARATEIDWHAALHDFARNAIAYRNDWSRQARRHAGAAIMYPRQKVDAIGKLAFGVDTSGSIACYPKLVAEFFASVDVALAETQAEAIRWDCDTYIRATYEIGHGVECPRTWQGGGGTDFRPIFQAYREAIDAGEQLAGLVIFTDGDGAEPDASEVDYPVLWLVYGSHSAPMATGRTIHIRNPE